MGIVRERVEKSQKIENELHIYGGVQKMLCAQGGGPSDRVPGANFERLKNEVSVGY